MLDSIPLLDRAECERVRQSVHGLRASWIMRGSPEYPFYTLGAASYIDAAQGARSTRYSELLLEGNPLLQRHFEWLYVRLMYRLSLHLQAEVRVAKELALPGFHVWEGRSVPTGPLSVHFDLQYLGIPWKNAKRADLTRPLSFTLAIALPREGGGLNSWDLSYEEQTAQFEATQRMLSMDELLQGRTRTFHAYAPGVLKLHSGHMLHQIAAVERSYPDDERITLQGHGLHCDGAWTIYW